MELPYRFREPAFRKYEADLARVVQNFPTPVTIVGPPSTETYSCRFRDAVQSLFDNRWVTSIDMNRFLTCYPYIKVAIRGGDIVIGDKQSVKEIPTLQPSIVKTVSFDYEELIDPDIDLLKATIVMHHHRLKVTPTLIKFSVKRDLKSEGWEDNFDIAIEPTSDGFKIL